MNGQEILNAFLTAFPQHAKALKTHIADYGKLLPHIFYAETISEPLIQLLAETDDRPAAKKYCAFIEFMWSAGDESVKNVVDVTILERLSDDRVVWKRFGNEISAAFRRYINEDLLRSNGMMNSVEKLNG